MAIPRDSLEMCKLNSAYVAGFIDGEGCIRIDKSHSPPRSTCYKLEVIVANTNLEVLTKLKEKYGGYFTERKSRNRTAYYWSIHGNPATILLKDIKPYLQVKAEQASVALKFQRVKTLGKPAPGRRLSQEELELREEYYQRIKALKSRKPVTTTKGHLPEMMV